MLKSLVRPLMIATAFIVGYFCPWAQEYHFLIRIFLIVMLYIVCLQVRFKQLKPHGSHWKLLGFNLLFPLAAWGICCLLRQHTLGLIAFFTAITPTANAAPVIIRFLGGSVSYVVTAFIITNLGVTLSLLGLLPLVTGNFTFAFFRDVVFNLLLIIGIPISAATVTRLFFPSAKEWPAKLANFSFALWVATLFIIAGSASAFLHQSKGISTFILVETALLSGLICAADFFTGFLLGEKRYRRESSQSLGQKNTTFTIFLAMQFANPLVAMGPTFYVLWHNLWNALQMLLHDRRQRHRKEKHERRIAESKQERTSRNHSPSSGKE